MTGTALGFSRSTRKSDFDGKEVKPMRMTELIELACKIISTIYPILKDIYKAAKMKKAACDLAHHKRKTFKRKA